MDYTTNYNLVKPARSQKAWDTLVNDNFDKIDNEIKNTNDKIGDTSQLDSGSVVAELENHASSLAEIVPNTTLWFLDKVNTFRTRAIISVQGFYDIDEDAYGKYRVVMVDGNETWSVVSDGTYSFKISDKGEIAENKILTTSDKKLRFMPKRDEINARLSGAKGDGVTDDTVVIQAAFNSLKNIFIPSGVYLVKNLIPHAGQIITGENYVESWGSIASAKRTVLKGNGGTSDYVIKNFINSVDGEARAVFIHDLNIDGNNKVTNGILCGNVSTIERCRIENCIKGISSVLTSRVTNCQILNNTDGIYSATDSKIDNNFIFYNTIGINLFDCGDSIITKNKIEWNGEGIRIEDGLFHLIKGNIIDRQTTYGINAISATYVSILGNQFERNLVNHISISGSGNNVNGNSMYKKNSEDDGSGTLVPNDAVAIGSLSNSVITGNYVYGSKMYKSTYTYQSNNVYDGNVINGISDKELSVVFTDKILTAGASVTFYIPYPSTFQASEWSCRVTGYTLTTGSTGSHYDIYEGIRILLNSSGVSVTLTNVLGTDYTFGGTIYLKPISFVKR